MVIYIRGRNIIISSEQGSGKDRVIIKNVLIDFLDLLSIFTFFSDEAHPKT